MNNTPASLVHIVPALPPQIDGVGDYALHLARQLRNDHGIESRFMVCDPNWSGPARLDGFAVRRLRIANEAGVWGSLASFRDNPPVLLHYVGYGYHKRGVPLWLYRGIRSWLADNGGSAAERNQFFTVFHELWASSKKPWKSEFYLRIIQKWIVARLHSYSTFSITSTRAMQTMLDHIQPRKTWRLPIPSNIPTCRRPGIGNRQNARLRVAIFGQHWSRSATVRAHANLLRTLDQKNVLASAMLVGKGLNPTGPQTEDLAFLQKCVRPDRIEVLGELPPEAVSQSLSRADVFLSPYRGELACKSGAFMAALATGCVAVLRDGANAAPLYESEHFIASDDSQPSVERFERIAAEGHLQRIARAALHWYQQNADWKVIAEKYSEALRNRLPMELSEGAAAIAGQWRPSQMEPKRSLG